MRHAVIFINSYILVSIKKIILCMLCKIKYAFGVDDSLPVAYFYIKGDGIMRKRILFKDEEISREIERRITEERMKEGDRMPSERQLAEDFGVQRDTVRCALEILLKKGVLVKRPRRGYYVAPKRIELNLNNFSAIKKEIESIGRDHRSILLSYEMISMGSKLSEMTRLPEGTMCYQMVRIRYDKESPISLERSCLIAEHVPGLSKEDLEHRSLASILRQDHGITLVRADQRITQVSAGDMEAELLRVDRGEPLIRYEGLIHDRRGRLIEFFDNYVIPDSIEFRMRDFV